jgi:type III secretion protein U
MNDETEDKSLPASSKKLHDARRKGQVSHSRDFITGFTLAIMLIYLWLAGASLGNRLAELVNVISQSLDLSFADAANRVVRLSLEELLLMSLPFMALVVIGSVVAGMIGTLGPVFSFELVTPKFSHVNPVQGFSRIFSIRNIVEFAKSTAKFVVLGTAFFLILRGAMEPLFETPICGAPCIITTAVQVAKPLAGTAAIAFLAVGLLDILVQRRLFLRDMRMTRTENKRELKDLQGDPLIRGERRRLRLMDALRANTRVGVSAAVIAIIHGDRVVGLRYRPGETFVPVVVCKAEGEAGRSMLAELRQRGIPIVDNADFVAALAARHGVGDMIIPELFEAAARVLVAAGIL